MMQTNSTIENMQEKYSTYECPIIADFSLEVVNQILSLLAFRNLNFLQGDMIKNGKIWA